MVPDDSDFAQFEDIRMYRAVTQEEFDARDTEKVPLESAPEQPHPTCEKLYLLERRVNRHRNELNELKNMLVDNTQKTERNNAGIEEVLAIVTMGKNFFRVLEWLGKGFKWISIVGTPIIAFLYWLRYGEKL